MAPPITALAVPAFMTATTNPIDPPEFHEVVKRRIYDERFAFGDADHTVEDMEALHADFYHETKVVAMPTAGP